MNHKNTDCHILIVDDNEQCQNLMKSSLYSSGITVYCASSGDEALRKMAEKTFSFLITDYNMPGMNGLELARAARAIAPDLNIILVTGDISPDIPRLAHRAGICRIFSKPISVSDILACIKKARNAMKATCF